MALLTKKEFAGLCGITTSNLSNYKTRGHVVYSGDYIDDSIDLNAAFLEKYGTKIKKEDPKKPAAKKPTGKLKVKAAKRPDLPAPNVGPDEDEADGKDDPAYRESMRELKALDVVKRRAEIEKIQLHLQKQRGELIPYDLVKPLFAQHNQSIVTEFKNAVDEIIRIFTKKRDLNVNEIAEINMDLIASINSAVTKAIKQSVKGVDDIVADFISKKNVGEREL
jgi:hypothetical protein